MKKILALLLSFYIPLNLFSMELYNRPDPVIRDFDCEYNPTYDLLIILFKDRSLTKEDVRNFENLGADINVALQIKDYISSYNLNENELNNLLNSQCVKFASRGCFNSYDGSALRLFLIKGRLDEFESEFFKGLGANIEGFINRYKGYLSGFEKGRDLKVFLSHMIANLVIPNYSPANEIEYLAKLFISAGADVNFEGFDKKSLLEKAIFYTNYTVIKILLNNGAIIKKGLIFDLLREYEEFVIRYVENENLREIYMFSGYSPNDDYLERDKMRWSNVLKLIESEISDSDHQLKELMKLVIKMNYQEIINFNLNKKLSEIPDVIEEKQKVLSGIFLILAKSKQKFKRALTSNN